MTLNTITVGAAVAPTVIETYLSHYLNRKPLRQRPTAHISYHEGLCLIRQFLRYASFHTVEDIQSFTSQWVPHPSWVKVDECTIPQISIAASADALIAQLGHKGIDRVGGSKWWQWRREGTVLKAEWIEMRGDYNARKERGDEGKKVMLYVHGGAYFFGSVDEHRYQMQRHARKLKARVFARMLVTLRDQGLPLPAGAILISPWVDLTHSFPSVAGDSPRDYIPAHGFLQRPSAAWPPPNADDMKDIALHAVENVVRDGMSKTSTHQEQTVAAKVAVQGLSVDNNPEHMDSCEGGNADAPANSTNAGLPPENTDPGPCGNLSITLDGKLVEIKDQIQMYATNQLLSHPLVSPVLQPSLGGLPPLLIMTGGGEMLRDEQIYLAHKAANPAKYPPGKAHLDEYSNAQDIIAKWKPTDVQLQVWDDLCHVAPTLSFTRPAKYMYRSIAQFGAWALAHAQNTEIEIPNDDDVSVISTGSDTETDSVSQLKLKQNREAASVSTGATPHQPTSTAQVGKAGDPLPPFRNHMVRQLVDRHGHIHILEPASSLPALQMPANEIGVIKPGPVRQWLEGKQMWDIKFAKDKRRVQKQRIKEMSQGFEGFGDEEVPPPSALAGKGPLTKPKREKKKKMSWGMSLWSLWGSSHDEKAIGREEKADKELEDSGVMKNHDVNTDQTDNTVHGHSRSRSRRRTVTDTGQTTSNADNDTDENTTVAEMLQQKEGINGIQDPNYLFPSPVSPRRWKDIEGDADTTGITGTPTYPARPTAGGVTFPFKLGRNLGDEGTNTSTVTLASMPGIMTPKVEGNGKKLGHNVENNRDGKVMNGDQLECPGNGNNGGEDVAVEAGVVVDARRPEPERFVTASEGLLSRQS